MLRSRCAVFGGVFIALTAAAQGQDVVPGGWSPRVGFRAFNGTGLPGSYAFPPAAVDPVGSPLVALGVGGAPAPGPTAPPFWSPVAPQTANGLGPLAGAVRRSARRRPSR